MECNRSRRTQVDKSEGWVREPGAVGWVDELDATGSGWSVADADYECIHGRRPGDSCPQPATVPGWDDQIIPNPARLWDKPYPCDCFGEAMPTPDPFAGVLTAPRRAPGRPPGREPYRVRY